jgi:hypothetical protein
VQAEIDDKLLREVKLLARERGRPERELLDEAVSRYLRDQFESAGSFGEYFERVAEWQAAHGVEPLSDEEAMDLANEELHAMRRDKKTQR